MTTRRRFLQQGALAAAGLSLPAVPAAAGGLANGTDQAPPRFLDLRRQPDGIAAQTAGGYVRLAPAGGRWEGGGVVVTAEARADALHVGLAASSAAVERLHLRWRGRADARLLLGDAWERSYGDLAWRSLVPDRVMPWYFAAWDGRATAAYGVRTGAAAFCFWRVDRDGVSLWADVRSGGVGVELKERTLAVCEVVSRAGRAGESPFAALHALCRALCAAPRLPRQPVYGENDWYWAYGKNSAASVREDAQRIVELSPPDDNRPFAVIDDGWQPERSAREQPPGLWDRGNEKFPDMPGLAADVRRLGARPGIWVRPLQAPADAPDRWRLARDRTALDPTVPEALAKVAADIGRVRAWGYELIKHDYSTWDLLGRWGFQMGAALTDGGWRFAEGPSRTTAEVVAALYDTIRTAAGDALVLGCNTVSHLSAGRFELCRTGDDTSGTDWSRVCRMGVNTLAFRGVQHGAFYAVDPDCVGVTSRIPWSANRQWLDLLARSGTVLFASLAPDALGEAQRRDLRAALARAAAVQPVAEAVDWQATTWPGRWRCGGGEQDYDWTGPDGLTSV